MEIMLKARITMHIIISDSFPPSDVKATFDFVRFKLLILYFVVLAFASPSAAMTMVSINPRMVHVAL